MRRLVIKGQLSVGRKVPLTKEQVHYLFDVLRKRPGEHFTGLDGSGKAFVLQLMARSEAGCLVLAEAGEASREPRLKLTQFLPLLKGDKLDWVVQKSVELGASEIVFYAAGRSIVKWTDNVAKKLARMEKIALEATQQCGRDLVPAIRGILTLEEAAGEGPGVFAWEEEETDSLRSFLMRTPKPETLSVLTGPEGGLSSEEAETLKGLGWCPVTLGPRILRAETAAIAMVTCAMFSYGEMEGDQ